MEARPYWRQLLSVTPARGFTVVQLTPSVQTAVETYVNALGMGATIVIAEVIAAVMALPGVGDLQVLAPSSNVSMPAGTLPRVTDVDVEVI